jgi:LPS sulfotransferase NodH
MRLLDPRNGPDFDLHPSADPPRAYVVASTPRSGSTLLCRQLWETHLLGAPKEYCNPMQVRDWEVRLGAPWSRWAHGLLIGRAQALAGRGWPASRMASHLRRVRERRSSGGWFGLKLHQHHFARHFGGIENLESVVGPVRWIRIRRHDRLGQAISWDRALQTNRWIRAQHEHRRPRYRPLAIEGRLRAIARSEQAWDDTLRQCSVVDLSFEELVADPSTVLQRVFRALGVPPPHRFPAPPADLGPMADGTSVSWAARFRARRGGA